MCRTAAAASRRIDASGGRSRKCSTGSGGVWGQRSDMLVFAAGYSGGVSEAISAGGHQHLPEFQPQDFSAFRGRLAGPGNSYAAAEVAKSEDARDQSRSLAFHGEYQECISAAFACDAG